MAAPSLPSLKDLVGTSAPKAGVTSAGIPKANVPKGTLPSLKSLVGGKGAGPAAVATPKKGGGSFLGNLAGDIESTLPNLSKGIEMAGGALGHDIADTAAHPLRHLTLNPKSSDFATKILGPLGHSYAQTYGPLVHGDIGKFAHNVNAHPLGPILDLATVLTGGAGAVAKGGSALAKTGVIAEDSRLATLGKAGTLTAPNFEKAAGQGGEDVVLKAASRNPVIRARQNLVNKGLNALPTAGKYTGIPGRHIGAATRVVRALSKDPERAAAKLSLMNAPFDQAFAKLSGDEKAAWHMGMRQVHPAAYAAHLEKQTGPVSNATLNILKSPKVHALFEKPSANLTDALTKGRALSETLTHMKLQAGHISEQAAAEAPYRLLRIVNGAKIGKDGTVDAKGRDLGTLARELHAQGKVQPSYVPDSADIGHGTRSTFSRKATGLAEPGLSGTSKQNLGVLANRGLLAINQNPLSREFIKFRNHTEGSLLHDELVKHAAALPHGEPLPKDYEYLKLNRGEPSAPYTEKVATQFEHGLEPGTADNFLTKNGEASDIATHPTTGERLVIPAHVRQILENKTLTYHGALHHLLYSQPTSVWKHIILGLRPAFFGNITVGNSILGALQMAPGRHGVLGWLNQVVPGAEKLLGKKLTHGTLSDVMPEQALGSFGHSTGFTSNKGLSLAKKAYQGVMPATIAYENVLRRAMAEGWAKASPEVRALMKTNGGDVNQALRDVAKSHPQTINDISKRIDDALGNYRTYNAAEQKIKQLIPFYGWDRHIVRSTARLASERPGRLNALTKAGQLGQQENDKTLGDLPSFLQGSIQLHHLPGFMGPTEPGRVPLLTTHSINPFNSVADLLRFATALGSGKAGAHSEELAQGLNPLITGAVEQITGRSLLTGATLPKGGPNFGLLGNVPYNVGANLPQSALIAALLGHGAKTKPGGLYQKDIPTSVAALLGAPIKKTNLTAAHRLKNLEGKPAR